MKEVLKKLAIITTHPIQYNAPLFQLLAKRKNIAIKVFYTWSQAKDEVFDPGFQKSRQWDVPLLEGYAYTFVANKAPRPGSHHFWGICNPELTRRVESWGADAVLVFGWCFWSHLRSMIYFKNRLPVFFRGDSTLLDDKGGVRTWWRRVVLRQVYRFIDIAFSVGTNNNEYYNAHGVQKGNLVLAPHAVDNTRFFALNTGEMETLTQWKQDLGISATDKVILFVGKLEEKKDPGFMLHLATELKDPFFKFVVVGNGKLEPVLKRSATDKRILFLNFQNQSQMPLVYRLGHLLVIPSKGPGETWGLAANEAMCAGVPVVLSSKVGGAADLVTSETGLVFQPGQVTVAARYIRKLVTAPLQYQRTSVAAREHIKKFSLEAVAHAIETTVIEKSKV